ncbi:MAG: hypothetical protein PHQ32_00900 [Firmicutes bacterium]|nr:hypothetical protein [Bacillota bacterium]
MMKFSKYYILGIIGTLLTLYYSILVIGLFNQNGLLMFTAGIASLLALLILIGFRRAKNLSAALFLLVSISNLVINNSILTAVIPAILGISLIIDRNANV